MEIKLDLTEHCIETESKLIYNRLIRRYFKSINNREDLELAIETLKSFLEQVDFSELRHTYPELAGSEIDASLIISFPQSIVIQLVDRQVRCSLVNGH